MTRELSVALVVLGAAYLVLVIRQRRAGAKFAPDKVDALQGLVGREVVLYVGTRWLYGSKGRLLEVNSRQRFVRLDHGPRQQDISLDRILAVADAQGSVRLTF